MTTSERVRRPRIALRAPTPQDREAFLAGVRASRHLHRPWVRPPDRAALFDAYLARMQPPTHFPFLVCRAGDGAIAGVVNLSHVVRGPLCSGFLGYYALAGFERQGLMAQGLRAVVRHAFASLGLHRLEANIQPANLASRALAQACGFRLEGFSPRYLKVGGRWRDHERWAICRD